MERLYDWVDANPPSPGRRFSGQRVAKLFVAIMVCSVLGALPSLLLDVGVQGAKDAREERRKQEHLQQQWNEMKKAVDDGQAGEATRRLFGVGGSSPSGKRLPAEAGESQRTKK